MPTLEQLNALDRPGFSRALGAIFEHSPWIAEATWNRRPFADAEALAGALVATMLAAPEAAQLALIRAHPDLAGKAALAKALTPESTREQAGAGLDRMTAEEYAAFHALNDAYRAKFGFPFIICVRHHDKASILAAFRRRLLSEADLERVEALGQIAAIARLRLADLLSLPDNAFSPTTEAPRHG
jgi:2-oxo-4-hydroxy-4-carboxy-5-ureidoimidazoline decarboxylase